MNPDKKIALERRKKKLVIVTTEFYFIMKLA